MSGYRGSPSGGYAQSLSDTEARVSVPAQRVRQIENLMPSRAPEFMALSLPERWRARLADADQHTESPTSVVNFLNCPLRWYVERHSGLDMGAQVNLSATVGTFVHRVLEIFFNEPPDLRTEEQLEEILAVAWAALDDGDLTTGIIEADLLDSYEWLLDHHDELSAWERAGERWKKITFGTPRSLSIHFLRASQVCVDNLLDFDPVPQGVRVVGNEIWVRASLNGVAIRGKIDRIDRNRGGNEILKDYKTGKSPKIEGEKVDLLDPTFIPVGMYAWMREQSREESERLIASVASVQLLYLRELEMFNLRITPQDLATVDMLLQQVTAAMREVVETGTVLATPSPSVQEGICRFCPLQKVCPAWSDVTLDDLAGEDTLAAALAG